MASTNTSSIKAVILDWAGTTVDFGSLAPVRAIQRALADRGLEVSGEEARRDMGLAKKDHIRNLLGNVTGETAEREVEEIYTRFIPVQMEMLEQYSDVIPGVAAAVERMRGRGLKIGSTTGYTRPMLDVVAAQAAAQGYAPDCSLVPGDVPAGRPHPFMIYEAALRLGASPLWEFVKIGDTEADIAEGRNAGTWTVGVADTGNMVGMSLEEWSTLPLEEARERSRLAHTRLHAAGAHFVIDALNDLDSTLDAIEELLAQGRRP